LLNTRSITALIGGVLADHVGPQATVAAGGLTCGLGSAWFAMYLPQIRQEARELILAQSEAVSPEV